MGRRGEGKQAENGEFLSELHPTVAQIRCFQAGQPGRNRRTSDRQVHRMAYGQTRKYALRKRKKLVELGDTRRLIATASVNRDLATLRRLLNVARQWKSIETVPVIRLLSGEHGHERVITH